mmetsp:Transcript_44700/g.43306  ORF Transcript_44700/g.43306 Transcript_44700/m.43306 type:complete len:253 (-) Transcript_44700:219-977(-)|eukprot:CAMPEP_0170558644 /NCGR_PEP_ID=MMETSP0211-20121228/36709_1 /TAXON_ID=311385 /ORGANISM="Pseudokeronopsis sp., Strain OXSARD2" /LENGTH=252 /DNA_ID=CAMNT_0010870789 /DNA_START=77 /DNA_END=835 /DNA_ORIENTATION=+
MFFMVGLDIPDHEVPGLIRLFLVEEANSAALALGLVDPALVVASNDMLGRVLQEDRAETLHVPAFPDFVPFALDLLGELVVVDDLVEQELEGRIHIGGVLGAGLEVGEPKLLRPLLRLLLLHLDIIDQIDLVAEEDDFCIFVGILLDFLHPVLAEVFEADLVGHVEHQDDPGGPPVVVLGQGAVLDLPSRVPNLYFYTVSTELDVLHLAVHTRSAHQALLELSLRVPVHQRTLPHSSVPQQQQLDVVSARPH